MDKLCGLYVRVSTERQAILRDGSLDTQMDRLKQYIKYREVPGSGDPVKWKLVRVYREEGKSGKNTDRPKLQQLLSDLKDGKINTILCTKIDRITRSLIDFYKLNDTFKKHNVDFISLEEGFDTSTPMGQAMLKMTLVWAELEREQTSKRTKDKLLWRAQQGLWNGGHVLGYDLKDKKLVVNKDETKLVNLMFNKYLECGSVLKVVEFLNEHGYRTKEYISRRKNTNKGGSAYYNQYVLHVLKNHLYLGEIEQHGKVYKGKHSPIVSKQLWHEVNRRIKLQSPKRSNPKREVKHAFLLQGLLKCGWCGDYMSTKYSTGRNGLCYYYQCTQNARKGKSACKMKYVPAGQLEKVVLAEIRNMSSDKKRLQKIVDEANKDTSSILAGLKKDRKIQEVKLTGINEKIKNIVHNVSASPTLKGVKSITQGLQELESQQEQVESDIQSIDFEIGRVQQQTMNAQVMYQSLTKFSQIYDAGEPQEIKDLLPLFVERVSWTPSEIEIALFEQEVQKGLLPLDSNHSSGGALEVKEWLPERGKYPNFSVELILGLNNARNKRRSIIIWPIYSSINYLSLF